MDRTRCAGFIAILAISALAAWVVVGPRVWHGTLFRSKPEVNVPALLLADPGTVAAALGPARTDEPRLPSAEAWAQFTPGPPPPGGWPAGAQPLPEGYLQTRYYGTPWTTPGSVKVVFTGGRASEFNVHLRRPARTAVQAASRVGYDLTGKSERPGGGWDLSDVNGHNGLSLRAISAYHKGYAEVYVRVSPW